MIKLNGVSHHIATADDHLTILHDINLSIEAGESVAITGSSGSGKTTLLGMLAGLDTPTGGEIIVDEAVLTSMNEDQRALFRAKNVGFIFQSFHLLDGLTALENVLLPLELAGAEASEAEAAQYLDQVGLSHRLTHYPSQLSGGEQQRVAIARAFAAKPRYLFADEPTGNLDQNTGATIIELLFEMNRQLNTTLILVTHEARLAGFCQRHCQIENGCLTEITSGIDAGVVADA
ncbi:Lipoprotein-releasing system ATP-binding protein LolD [Sinobacterium norvegicum]|uniref:Lipoprotein-releasing system ATP-binding protein LolD n=1 Tax=Sinobacterium norvegicum TaxID=1641715 RepID=A0ABM9AAI5_9GAMM|nr:ABC transporter ATP-binding protein [Sinobacterium norvegicum]CAH0990230.1 Lipoprotein-releasing system ATP-binding protein LolD [Sinobacterium norvegicum]